MTTRKAALEALVRIRDGFGGSNLMYFMEAPQDFNTLRVFIEGSKAAPADAEREWVAERLVNIANDEHGGVRMEDDAAILRQAARLLRQPSAERAEPVDDTRRLDWLDSQRKWGDAFAALYLDSGDCYVRPWRYALEPMKGFEEIKAYTDIRYAIDAAMLAAAPKPEER